MLTSLGPIFVLIHFLMLACFNIRLNLLVTALFCMIQIIAIRMIYREDFVDLAINLSFIHVFLLAGCLGMQLMFGTYFVYLKNSTVALQGHLQFVDSLDEGLLIM